MSARTEDIEPSPLHNPASDFEQQRRSSEYTLQAFDADKSSDPEAQALPSPLAQDIATPTDSDKSDLASQTSPVPSMLQNGALAGLQRWFRAKRQNKIVHKVESYFAGPSPPAEIKPIIIKREIAFEKGLNRRLRRIIRPSWLIWPIFLAVWIVAVALLVNESWYNATTAVGEPSIISNQASFWSRDDECGLNGSACEPFNDANLAFRCGARSVIELLNPRAIGNQEINYRPLVVGGGDPTRTYRADSWLCAAAVQQGLVSTFWGGCAVARQTGTFSNYIGFSQNGISSVGFDSIFPSSYILDSSPGAHCKDLKWPILAFQVGMLFIFSMFLLPTPATLFWVSCIAGFWQIALTKGKPDLSTAFADFLPSLFVLYALWRCSSRYVLPYFSSLTLERSVLFLGPFWVGVLMDVTLESWIPVDRLTPHDIQQRPGGLVAVIILSLLVAALVINQLRIFRKAGLFPRYFGLYALVAIVIGILSALPGLELRLHHYIFGLIALPLTRFPTRLSLVLNGLLLGIFLNGIAIWGYDSILQTPDELRGDASLGSDLPEWITNNATFTPSAGLRWQAIPEDLQESWNGFALLVDDVLAWTGSDTNYTLNGLLTNVTHYFRLAYTQNGDSGDFTRPATWYTNGTFVDSQPGSL